MRVENHLLENSRIISNLQDVLVRTVNDIKGLVKHLSMVQTQMEQITKVQKDQLAKNANSNGNHAFGIATRSGAFTQDPLYPERHTKRIE